MQELRYFSIFSSFNLKILLHLNWTLGRMLCKNRNGKYFTMTVQKMETKYVVNMNIITNQGWIIQKDLGILLGIFNPRKCHPIPYVTDHQLQFYTQQIKLKLTAELVDILLKICQVQNNSREFKSMGIMLQLELFE